MDCKEQDKITAFDTLFSNNHIQMLKILLPFVDSRMQKLLAIYIKFLELSYTIDFCKKHTASLFDHANQEPPDLSGVCHELIPFCSPQEKKQIEQMSNIFQSLKMYQEMSKTMEAMKEFMPDMGDLFQNMQAASFTGGNPFTSGGFQETGQSSQDAEETSSHESSNSGFNITNMLMNMMTPEQKEMFELFGGNDHAE